jgi:hypothetical protein
MEQEYISSIQPDLWVGGVRLTEPVIALTSFFITAVCAYAWLRLGGISPRTRYVGLMRAFFLFMGLSTLYGGVFGHAFLHLVPFGMKAPGWLLGMAATAALAQAAIEDARPNLGLSWPRFLTLLNWVGFGAAAVVVVWQLFFPLVEVHAAFCLLLLVLPLQVFGLRQNADTRRNVLTLWGIALAALAVVPHLLKFSPSPWFSYFDIGHVLMCTAIWMFMLAAKSLEVGTLKV